MRDLLVCFCIILTITFSMLAYHIDSPPSDKLILITILFTAPSTVFHIQHVQPFSKNLLQIFYFYFKSRTAILLKVELIIITPPPFPQKYFTQNTAICYRNWHPSNIIMIVQFTKTKYDPQLCPDVLNHYKHGVCWTSDCDIQQSCFIILSWKTQCNMNPGSFLWRALKPRNMVLSIRSREKHVPYSGSTDTYFSQF